MKKYIYLEHTADGKFQAFGKTLEEAFKNSALAMLNLVCETKKVKAANVKKIEVKGKDKEALLYNFLEELLFLLDSKNFLFKEVRNIKITEKGKGYLLKTEITGDDASNYEFFGEIKAATYNSMLIKEDKKTKKFIIQVVIDL